jgi:quinol monooxygenase YgiN
MRFGLHGKLTAVPGQGDALGELLLEAARALESMPQCELYLVSRDDHDEDAIWVTEVWSSRETHRESLNLSNVREIITRARPLIAEVSEQTELTPLGGKGVGN